MISSAYGIGKISRSYTIDKNHVTGIKSISRNIDILATMIEIWITVRLSLGSSNNKWGTRTPYIKLQQGNMTMQDQTQGKIHLSVSQWRHGYDFNILFSELLGL